IEQLKKDKEALRRERDELRVKVSSLTSPDRIARLATDQLGMVRPARGQVVLVRLSPVEPAPGKDVGPAIRLARLKAVLRAR
ncbi:MAG: cell division protein FtsL, partial [Nitrospirales bacterium]